LLAIAMSLFMTTAMKQTKPPYFVIGLVVILTPILAACGPGDTAVPPLYNPKVVGRAEYGIEQTISLLNEKPGKATDVRLRVALVRDIEPYQDVVTTEITPHDFETITDDYGNQYAEFTFADVAPGGNATVKLRYEVVVNALEFDLTECEGLLPDMFVDPEQYIESADGRIVALAAELAEDQSTACDKARTYYDYIGDNLSYAGYQPDDNGALATLEDLAGDCTDFVDLLVALNRAAGIPARFIEGVTCCTNGDYVEGETKHSWLEVYLPGIGWVPMDPTWGREESDRERYFAAITPDHIVVTKGRNPSSLEHGGETGHYFTWWWDTDGTVVSKRERWRVFRLAE
jgi:transglutaminase-like putative cysteine protease